MIYGTLLLQVHNAGPPLSEEQLERLFEPFYRDPSVERRASLPGWGLGLTISKGFVERHGGQIWAESGDGVTFFCQTACRRTTTTRELFCCAAQ